MVWWLSEWYGCQWSYVNRIIQPRVLIQLHDCPQGKHVLFLLTLHTLVKALKRLLLPFIVRNMKFCYVDKCWYISLVTNTVSFCCVKCSAWLLWQAMCLNFCYEISYPFLLWQSSYSFCWQASYLFCCDKHHIPFAVTNLYPFCCDNHYIPFAVTSTISLLLWLSSCHVFYDKHSIPFAMTNIISPLLWQALYPFCCNNHHIRTSIFTNPLPGNYLSVLSLLWHYTRSYASYSKDKSIYQSGSSWTMYI